MVAIETNVLFLENCLFNVITISAGVSCVQHDFLVATHPHYKFDTQEAKHNLLVYTD